jgi:hypothetical protein
MSERAYTSLLLASDVRLPISLFYPQITQISPALRDETKVKIAKTNF